MLNRLKDVFESFQNHEVRYVVIGGIAAARGGAKTMSPLSSTLAGKIFSGEPYAA